MYFNDFQTCKISGLGMGTMRLPVKSSEADIDVIRVEKMIACALEHGINYFDTAWNYHEGKSEEIIAKILRQYPRDSYYFADKFPGFDPELAKDVKGVFEKQLQKTGLEYFDFYLLHSVTDDNLQVYLDRKLGIVDYLLKQKEEGHIRHLGFSCHCEPETIEKLLNVYGQVLEFGQIQLNWLDYSVQKAGEKLGILKKHGIPVWVMEPLRGGRLDGVSFADSFRFLQNLGVTVILSGMSDENQILENTETFAQKNPLSEEETNRLIDMGREMAAGRSVPCTGCRYCISYCPQEINIPEMISKFNNVVKPDAPVPCIGCGNCAAVCPQQINIPEIMSKMG